MFFPGDLSGLTASSVTLTASSNPANYGQAVTLNASITAGATGKVTFYDGTTILGMGAIVGTHATLTTVMLPAGTRSLRAYYVGDGTYTSSSSPSVPETVVAGTSLGLHPPIDLPSPWATAAIAVGDFNADGKLDLVSSDTITSSVIVFLGNGNGTFQTGVNYTVPSLVHSIAVGDFDGDGTV